jgi:hypothetical protein
MAIIVGTAGAASVEVDVEVDGDERRRGVDEALEGVDPCGAMAQP